MANKSIAMFLAGRMNLYKQDETHSHEENIWDYARQPISLTNYLAQT